MKSAQIKTSVIIPAYKEEEGLPIVLEKVFKFIDDSYEVIVVDDGSPDKTSEKASYFPCKLVRHERNQGKGEAMKTGAREAQGENIIFIDADDTYPVEAIPGIAKDLESFDMVVASRARGRENIPRFNRMGNSILAWLIRVLHGSKVKDPLTGLYGLKTDYFERMQLSSEGFSIETEITIKAARMKLRVTEVGIEYKPRLGEQKLGGIRDGWRILKTTIGEKIRPSSLAKPE